MQQNLREYVRRHLGGGQMDGPYVDVETLTATLMEELGYDSATAQVMLSRLIMNECALAGIAMRLRSPGGNEDTAAPPQFGGAAS